MSKVEVKDGAQNTEQATTVTQCPKFGWCVMGHAHRGRCSSTPYILVSDSSENRVVTEPRVEAGDRALETARKLCGGEEDRKIYVYGGLPEFAGHDYGWASAEQIAALIQSAMNAQERELRSAAIQECADFVRGHERRAEEHSLKTGRLVEHRDCFNKLADALLALKER